MSSPIQQFQIDLRKNKSLGEFKAAAGRNLTESYIFQREYMRTEGSSRGWVINVFGAPKSGRSLVAKKLAYDLSHDLEEEIKIKYSWSFREGTKLSSDIVIVEPGESEKDLLEIQDEIGSAGYRNAANNFSNIFIIITYKPIKSDFGLECLSITDDAANRTMLWTSGYPIGNVFLNRAPDYFIEELDEISEQARLEFMRSEFEKIQDNLNETTREMLEYILIPEKILFLKKNLRKTENAIKPLKMLVFGDIGTGKTTLCEIFYYLFLKTYGHDFVNAWKHEDDLGVILQNAFTDDRSKFIEFFSIDDATYNLAEDSYVAHDWINLRHKVNEATGGTRENRSEGKQQGLVCGILCLHRLTGSACPTAFRTSFDYQFILDIPTNKWDKDYVQALISSPVHFDWLKEIAQRRKIAEKKGDVKTYKSLLGVGLCISKVGIFPFDLNLDKYKSADIPLMKKSSTWANTWRQIIEILLNKYKFFRELPPKHAMDWDITQMELRMFGRVRRNSEAGINYRTLVKNAVKSEWEPHNSSNSTDRSIDRPKRVFRTSESEFPLDLIAIVEILLNKFAAKYKYEESMKDYLEHTFNKTNREIADKFDKSNSSVSDNINAMRERLYKSSETGGLGFIWEQAIFIYAFKLYENYFGSAIIKIYDQNNDIPIKESTELIERDYAADRKYTFVLTPPAGIEVVELAPTLHRWFSIAPAREFGRALPQLSWMGGWSEDDFILTYWHDAEEEQDGSLSLSSPHGAIASVVLECKSSTVRTKRISPKKPGCECRIRKVHDAFSQSGGFILHFHPWEIRTTFTEPGNIPPAITRKLDWGRGVIDDILLINNLSHKTLINENEETTDG